MALDLFQQLLAAPQTVFSFKELLLRWGQTLTPAQLSAKLNYRVQQGDLYQIRRGLYTKNSVYDRLELATKIYTPAYISFETVLVPAGIIFQHYTAIFVASYQTRTVTCDEQVYIFKQLKATILTNSAGLDIKAYYTIASPERAFLDTVYLHPRYHFDNLAPLDWHKVGQLLPVYGYNKAFLKRVQMYHQAYQAEQNQPNSQSHLRAVNCQCQTSL